MTVSYSVVNIQNAGSWLRPTSSSILHRSMDNSLFYPCSEQSARLVHFSLHRAGDLCSRIGANLATLKLGISDRSLCFPLLAYWKQVRFLNPRAVTRPLVLLPAASASPQSVMTRPGTGSLKNDTGATGHTMLQKKSSFLA